MKLRDKHWLSNGFLSAPIPMLVIQPFKNSIYAANLGACRFLECDLPTLMSKKVSSLFSDSYAQLIVFTEEMLDKGSAWSDSLFISLPLSDGNKRVEINGHSRYEDGEVVVTVCFQDAEQLAEIRDRADAQHHYRSGLGHWQRMTKVFQEFERENRLLLEAAGEGIYGVDANGLTTFVNPAGERILGWKAEALIGKNMHDLIHANHADGSHFHVGECPIYQAFREGIIRNVDDDVFWTKSGKPIDVEYTSTPIKDNGHVVGAVVVFRDVTEKKEANNRLRKALQEVESLKSRLEMENAYLQEELSSEYNHHQILGKSSAIK
ncbi:MAG: PAS domain S-box protein, partial [Pseudomonadales bacterium]|nr:PAS domain S-box protein [Pseudomonadales bacterium]